MKTGLWAAMIFVLVTGVSCATPPAQGPDHETIKGDADKAFKDLKEEESRRSHEGEERY